MLTTSLWLWVMTFLINVLTPLLIWVLVLILLFGDKIPSIRLYIIWRFLGVGVISHWLFDIQLIYFGVWGVEYMILLVILICLIVWKYKYHFDEFISALTIHPDLTFWSDVKRSYFDSSIIAKWIIIIWLVYVWYFCLHSMIHTTHFPAYADDSFGNRNKPAVNIYYDWWYTVWWQTWEILWRARLWYPIHLSVYKSMLADMQWWRYDVYMDRFQYIWFILILFLSFHVTRYKTKNIFFSVLPSILICGMPLIFWHVIDSYHELPSVYYSIIAIYMLYLSLQDDDLDYLSLGLIFLWILAYIKNDWFVVYVPSIIISISMIYLHQSKLLFIIRKTVSSFKHLAILVVSAVLMFLPFLFIKFFYGLWFNQAQWTESGIWLSQTVHWEIFGQFKNIFWSENNYNLILIFMWLIIYVWYQFISKKQQSNLIFLCISPVILFIVFTLVFLLTENYQFVMNQTTVNRTYTACFMISLFFVWVIMYEYINYIPVYQRKNKSS